jgi:hypothetical protein
MLPLGFIKRLVVAQIAALLSGEHVMLCRVAVLCKRRIMLTGTPLQNDLQELQNLLEFLLPDIFHEESAAELSAVQVRPNFAWCLKRHSAAHGQLMAGKLAKACDAAGLLHAFSRQGICCRHA